MNRNQYDTDVTVFSPQGRLFQVEYAMEAVKQGSAVVGVRGKQYAVVCALRRQASELASYQHKIFKVDDHIAMGISGLVGDARSLQKYMRSECLNHKYVFDAPIETSRLIQDVADKAQVYTQQSTRRPHGVGLMVISHDAKTGPHLHETSPSGMFFEWKAHAFGDRCQGARTYIEKHFDDDNWEDLSLDELIKVSLEALKACAPDGELTVQNTSIAVVGPDTPVTLYNDDKVEPYVRQIATAAAAESSSADAMEED